MKRVKKFYILVILFFIFWPLLSVKADPEFNFPQTSGGFMTEGGGKCIFYLGGGCDSAGWHANPASNCSWEPCCKSHMNGYPVDEYTYAWRGKCANKTLSWGYEFETPDKSKCTQGLDCCCSTLPPAVNQNTPPADAGVPKFTIPTFQVPIDTVKLSEATCTGTPGQYVCQVPWIGEYITGIYNYGLSVAGILAAIMLMAGGLLWLISGGDAGKITQAKELIVGSVTGLIILAASFIILVQINPNLVKFKPLSIQNITAEQPESTSAEKQTEGKGIPNRKTTQYIVLHTAAGLLTRDQVDAYHKSLGWQAIGYNFYIERGGQFVVGRGEMAVGAHALNGYNAKSIGISYSGCYDKSQWNNKTIKQALENSTITQTQLDTLIREIKIYQAKYHIPRQNVIGHYEVPANKACPCLPMDEIRSLISP